MIGVSAGADVYAPTLGYLIAMLTAVMVVYVGGWIETKMRVDDAVGAVAVHGVSGFLGILWVGIFAAGYPTGLNNVESGIGGQLMGLATFLPLGFLSGWVISFVLKKLNLLRVPIEVETRGPGPGRVRDRLLPGARSRSGDDRGAGRLADAGRRAPAPRTCGDLERGRRLDAHLPHQPGHHVSSS